MKRSNFALRLQPSLMEASRKLAESEGVALNQLFNVAVAQMIASHAAADCIAQRAKRADVQAALEILRRPRKGEPPREGDELPESWKRRRAPGEQETQAPPPTRSK
jgi:uncharacterized protein (DUF3084 family)